MNDIFSDFNLGRILIAVAVVGGAAWAAGYLTREAERASQKYIRHRHWLMNGAAVVRFTIYITAVVVAATTLFNFSNEALIASAGAIALTFSLAFQDLASSFVGGITLLIDRPFQVGDRVAFKDHYGDITEIGLRSVRLRTLDDSIVAIPNNQFLKEAVASSNTGDLNMLVAVHFYIEPNSSFALAKQLVYEALVTSKYAYLAKPVSILVEEQIVDVVFTTHITGKAYVFNTDYEKAFVTDVTERVKEAFRANGIRSSAAEVAGDGLPEEAPA